MECFRVYFHLGWCSADVRAEDSAAAARQVWKALDELSHGAMKGLRLGSFTVSDQHTRTLGGSDHCGFEFQPLADALRPGARPEAPSRPPQSHGSPGRSPRRPRSSSDRGERALTHAVLHSPLPSPEPTDGTG